MEAASSVTAAVDNGDAVVSSRSDRKRAVIAAAATEAFLTGGYWRTSMDEVARLAKVSKQTVYMHFGSKEQLLSTIVMEIVTTAGDPLVDDLSRLGETVTLEADLRHHARQQLAAVLQPRPMQLRRLIIAESNTFPELARQFYELGPGRAIASLTVAFARLIERGLLNATDPARAATDYNWLVMSDPLNRVMILGDTEAPGQAAISRWADQSVDTFLAAYTSSREIRDATRPTVSAVDSGRRPRGSRNVS